jgi:hypothetical protein
VATRGRPWQAVDTPVSQARTAFRPGARGGGRNALEPSSSLPHVPFAKGIAVGPNLGRRDMPGRPPSILRCIFHPVPRDSSRESSVTVPAYVAEARTTTRRDATRQTRRLSGDGRGPASLTRFDPREIGHTKRDMPGRNCRLRPGHGAQGFSADAVAGDPPQPPHAWEPACICMSVRDTSVRPSAVSSRSPGQRPPSAGNGVSSHDTSHFPGS